MQSEIVSASGSSICTAMTTFTVLFQVYMVAPVIPALSNVFRTSVENAGLIIPVYLMRPSPTASRRSHRYSPCQVRDPGGLRHARDVDGDRAAHRTTRPVADRDRDRRKWRRPARGLFPTDFRNQSIQMCSRKFERRVRQVHWQSSKTISISQVQLRSSFANGGCGHGMALAGGRERLNETEVDYAVDKFVADQSACPMVWQARAKFACHTGGSDVVAGDCANPCRSH